MKTRWPAHMRKYFESRREFKQCKRQEIRRALQEFDTFTTGSAYLHADSDHEKARETLRLVSNIQTNLRRLQSLCSVESLGR